MPGNARNLIVGTSVAGAISLGSFLSVFFLMSPQDGGLAIFLFYASFTLFLIGFFTLLLLVFAKYRNKKIDRERFYAAFKNSSIVVFVIIILLIFINAGYLK